MRDETRGRGARRGHPRHQQEQRTTAERRLQIRGWFAGRLPEDWFEGPADISVDDDEILVIGILPTPSLAAGAEADEARVAAASRIAGFREDSRAQRMRIAEEAQAAFGRAVSWAATCGDTTASFTNANVPVMTRLRMPERQVLDTLIGAGVARSRSEALAWCVRLVGQNEDSWISQLRTALEDVEAVRAQGPHSASSEG